MKKILIFYYILIIVFIPSAVCFSANLEELEKRIGLSDDSLILDAELLMGISANDKATADSGLKVSGGVGYGWSREPESLTSSQMIYYEKLFSRLALTIPVLGSRWQEQTGILKTGRTILIHKHAVEIYNKTALASLRKEYIDFWVSGRKLELARAFLKDEGYVTSVLKERIRPGFLLKADFQEFITPFDRARKEVANLKRVMKKACLRMSRLTGLSFDQCFIGSPNLPWPEMDIEKIEERICVYNPEIEILEQIVSKNNEIHKKTVWSGFESSVDLAYAPARTFPGEFGDGASISFNVKAPFDVLASNRAAEKIAELEIRKSRLYIQKIKNEIMADYKEFKLAYHASLENLKYADQRLASAYEWLRETKLRLEYSRGEVFEKYLQARYNYFTTAIDALDAEALTFKACSDLLMIAEEKTYLPQPRTFTPEILPEYGLRKRWISQSNVFIDLIPNSEDKTDTGISQQERNGSNFGVYIWDSQEILKENSDRFWIKLKNEGVDRILVSFDGHQIEQIRTGKLTASLFRFIENAQKNGILTELLLGEPSWIMPEKRSNLLNIIKTFENFEFDGLHLDIEPDQLKTLDDKERKIITGYVLDTLKDVLLISRWPLGISIHPRYFDEKTIGICLGCELETLGINEVSLMIYSSDIQKVSAKAGAVMKVYPLLRFSVAQSFEEIIPKQESHYNKGKTVFREDMEKLANSIKYSNFNSIIIQSWKDIIKESRK
ncbi:MAG: TolC family protein [Proteobacteria bacterium]|nr:TolC family protein [Pseudomonadota bacterium]